LVVGNGRKRCPCNRARQLRHFYPRPWQTSLTPSSAQP
jgi:hypothetical protein